MKSIIEQILRGSREIPGSKSILQRVMVLCAHARADILLKNYNPCTDVLELENALRTFGFELSPEAGGMRFRFREELFEKSEHIYYFEGSATAFRLWLSVLANLHGIKSKIHCSERLFRRGFSPLQKALEALGAHIEVAGNSICINGYELAGWDISVEGSLSSQFHSSLLLAAPFMKNPVKLALASCQVSLPYMRLSINMLEQFGVQIDHEPTCVVIQPGDFGLPREYRVDADMSTAAFYAVQGALRPEGIVFALEQNPRLPQADAAVFDILRRMGAVVSMANGFCEVKPGFLQGVDISLKDAPDLMPVLSILALFCNTQSRFSGIGRLIHKESNRVKGICRALDMLGADYQRDEDSLTIFPLGEREIPALTLDTLQDHRLVMAFSLLQSRFEQISLSETQSLSKSLPLPG
jgi:3-phosphoshikimate 1-carboxyvinyltransferase